MSNLERLLGLEDDEQSNASFEDEMEEQEKQSRLGKHQRDESSSEGEEEVEEEEEDDSDDEQHDLDIHSMEQMTAKPLTQEKLKKFQEKIERTGVCYMSRVPPFMKHTKVRSLLSKYGEIGRIYLNPEDPKITARRKKYKHNKRKNFTEGWIEFMDKKTARQTAEQLNGTQIGGKKRSFYYEDLWNIKYLPKFKWNHLTEQLAYELKVKEQKLRTEMHQAKRENNLYIKNVNKSKMIAAIEERKRKNDEPLKEKTKKQFKQRKVRQEQQSVVTDTKKKMLSKIFQ